MFDSFILVEHFLHELAGEEEEDQVPCS